MLRKRTLVVATVLALGLAAGGVSEAAKYRYGRYSGGGGDEGVTIFLEGGLDNVRNSDHVLATSESLQVFGGGLNTVTALTPASQDDPSARLGFAYQWASGNRLTVSFWAYSTDTQAAAEGPLSGALHYALGPPIALGGGTYVGASGSPGYFDLTTETDAATADVAFGREHELADDFRMEWSIGLRYASYEELTTGFYDDSLAGAVTFGDNRYAAEKSIQGDMVGARVAARGSYLFTPSFSVSAGIGAAFLDGEIESFSGLLPTGLVNGSVQPASLATFVDDGRSGRTFDIDTRVTWHSFDDRLRVWLGWEQQEWSGIAADMLRNFPGTARPLEPRDSIVLSGYRLGVSYRF